MILIDDVYDDKEEISGVVAILPQRDAEQRDRSDSLRPAASDYGTFGSNKKCHRTRRKAMKVLFVVWIIVAVVFGLVGYKFAWGHSSNTRIVPGSGDKTPPRAKKPADKIPIDDARIRTPSCVLATPGSSDSRASEAIIFMNDDRPNKAAAKFSIPVTSDLVHFFNNGSIDRGFGFIHISVSEERRSDIQVDVTISYDTEDQLKSSKICLVEDVPGEMGVGVVFPTHNLTVDGQEQIRFDFDVTLPSPLDERESELLMKSLKTNFTLVHHRLDDLFGKVKFESVSLRTSFMPIAVWGLSADSIEVRSQDSLFDGKLYATKSVDLQTTISPISVNITMTNNDTRQPSEVVLKTTNSPIDAILRFFSDNSDGGARFTVDAETENAHLGVYNHALPSRSTLAMKARTSRGPITILAPPKFEGSFDFSARPSPPLIEPRRVEDPEGQGRERRVFVSDLNKNDRTVNGKVWWDEGGRRPTEPQPRWRLNSSIEAETTYDPIFFKLYNVPG